MGVDGREEKVTRGAVARWPASLLSAPALTVILATFVLLGGCGSPATTPGAGADASAGTAATSAATRTPSALPTAKPSPARTPKTPRPTPSAPITPAASAAGGVGKGASPGSTTVVFVDVGQGDAAVIKSGSWTGLVDGGPPGSEAAVEAVLAKLGVRRLSAVVVSHMHADHIGGLPRLVGEWRPRTAYVAGTPTSALAGALGGAGTNVVQVRRGATLRFGAGRAEVLSPAGLSGDPNSDSVVLRLDAGGKSFLFTGDCTGLNEAAVGSICARGPPIDVLKVAHHGSRYSTSAEFLVQTRPRIAVISVGPNSYGHPTAATVDRLLASGTRLYTTWKNGDVTFTVTAPGAMSVSPSGSNVPVTSAADARAALGGGSAAAGGAASGAPGGATVYVTRTGECYHRLGCRYLAASSIPISLREARQKYRPCSVCDPPI